MSRVHDAFSANSQEMKAQYITKPTGHSRACPAPLTPDQIVGNPWADTLQLWNVR